MFERVVSLDVHKAYEELKGYLLKNNCKIIGEEPSKSITVEQGSFWGFSPRGVKKRISFYLQPYDSKTRIVSISSLSSEVIILNVFGWIMLIIFAFIFGELEATFKALSPIPTVREEALALAGLCRVMMIVSVILVIFDIVYFTYIYARLDQFSEETLRLLP